MATWMCRVWSLRGLGGVGFSLRGRLFRIFPFSTSGLGLGFFVVRVSGVWVGNRKGMRWDGMGFQRDATGWDPIGVEFVSVIQPINGRRLKFLFAALALASCLLGSI